MQGTGDEKVYRKGIEIGLGLYYSSTRMVIRNRIKIRYPSSL